MMKTLPALLLVGLLAALPAQASGVSNDYAANLEARLQSLEQQMARMMGYVEQAQHEAQSAKDRLAKLEADIDTRFRMMEQNQGAAPGPAQYPSTPSPSGALDAQDQNLMGQLTGGPLNNNGATGASSDLPDDPSQAYDQAFRSIRDGDYDAAEVSMREFMKRWPTHELASNASYWLSETYYVRGDFEKAAKGFAETYQKFPKGSKAEDTLLKLALSLSALSRDKDACVTFEQLDAEFQHMSQANRRRMEQERANLRCNSSADTKPASPRKGSNR